MLPFIKMTYQAIFHSSCPNIQSSLMLMVDHAKISWIFGIITMKVMSISNPTTMKCSFIGK